MYACMRACAIVSVCVCVCASIGGCADAYYSVMHLFKRIKRKKRERWKREERKDKLSRNFVINFQLILPGYTRRKKIDIHLLTHSIIQTCITCIGGINKQLKNKQIA